MLDIEKVQYSVRKDVSYGCTYGDDIAVLFYKGHKVAKCLVDDLTGNWSEEASYFDTITELFDDLGYDIEFNIDEEDNNEAWDDIAEKLDENFDKKTSSGKYKNWELIVLDI